MMTKDQERAALEQIKQILSTLEPDGYVNTAFEGCVDDAAENIKNDFMCSWKQRAQSEEKKAEEAVKKANETKKELEAAYISLSDIQRSNDAYSEEIRNLKKQVMHLTTESKLSKDKVKAAEIEVIRLKAKLYDFMVRESEGKHE